MRRRDQFLQDPAFAGGMSGLAVGPQGRQLLLQGPHRFQPGADPPQMLIDQLVDIATVGLRTVNEAEQTLHVGQGHVEGSAVADEGKALQVQWAIGPVAVGEALRGLQQTRLLVVPDGLDIHAGCLAQLANFHVHPGEKPELILPP